ncbi:MAG: DUF899 family protein [Candidatus Cloacimonetes bacterium]|nr:DUF899 family protein [Candidatus Cloacimonadota bacterium]
MSPDIESQMQELYKEIEEKQSQLLKLKKSIPAFEVEDYSFSTLDGEVKLSTLFGDFDELILVYNMGSKCPYCALWADEYNGVFRHLSSRAAFVVSSPDTPQLQSEISKSRKYVFPMVQSSQDFRKQMKFEKEDGSVWPGFSVFQKTKDNKVYHVSKDYFGPGDQYCGVWHFFDLLPSDKEWHPKH